MIKKNCFYLLLLFLSTCLMSCQSEESSSYKWFFQLREGGTNSSPHVVDLTNDGVKDIVIGAGGNENDATAYAVLAINGETGEELWRVPGLNQMVGSAIFQDINKDDTPDVFIGGRSAMLFAIDGKTGKVIWKFDSKNPPGNAINAIFNFYHPQFVPDQNNDGIQEILVSNGGNVMSPAHTNLGRLPGILMIVDGATGKVIAADIMPDGEETYMSPIFYQENGNDFIIFGSGGETNGGNLFQITLQQLLEEKIGNAKILLQKQEQGFIAPPVVVDITKDGVKDVIVNWHGGEVYAIDGASNQVIWHQKFEGTEANASPTPGFYNNDDTIDFFSSFQKGNYPRNLASIHWMVNGKTGAIEYQDTLGCTGFASANSFDLDEDKMDEVILTYNDFNCFNITKENIVNRLVAVDFSKNKTKSLLSEKGKNISSTTWIGDLDNDKKADLIYVIQVNHPTLLYFDGFGIGRIQLDSEISSPPTWGAYMGNDYNGVLD